MRRPRVRRDPPLDVVVIDELIRDRSTLRVSVETWPDGECVALELRGGGAEYNAVAFKTIRISIDEARDLIDVLREAVG